MLIVLARNEVGARIPGTGKTPPCIKVEARRLPKLSESWRWAHSQVVHDGAVDDATLKRLQQEEPHKVTSRLLCARRLEASTRYEAVVVPAFAAGVAAATGNVPAGMTSLSPAWTDDAQGEVTLPCYYQWEFGTGKAGDFETMARALKPSPLGDIGVRDFACGDPGFGVGMGGGQPLTLKLEGAIRSVQPPESPPLGSAWGHDAATVTPYHERLVTVLNQPSADLAQRGAAAPDPIVGPPIYGRWHAARSSVVVRDGTRPSLHWVDQLNLDPRHRAAAGLGARVAEKTQEAFMASAWRQVGDVERANDIIRRAQLAREGSATLHRRYSALPLERKASFLAPAAKRVMGADNARTLATRVGTHKGISAALDPAFRRISRSRGSIMKRQSAAKRVAAGSLLARLRDEKPLRAAGAAPAPKGAQTWSSIGRQVAATNAPAAAIAAGEREIQPVLVAGIKALAGTPIGTRYGSAAQLDALAASVGETLTGFLAAGQADGDAPASPFGDIDAEFARPILGALDPEKSIARKVAGLLGRRPALRAGADALAPILAAPEFPQPMYEELRDLSQQYLMPGAEKVPENAVAILEMNRRFVEAYLAGLNHEFARELRWREYPTDQRGTYFRHFWDAAPAAASGERRADIRRMHEWKNKLGSNADGEVANPALVLLRADLLRRYPHTLIYVVEADARGMPVVPDESHPAIEPIFSATLPPDMYFFGFNMAPAALRTGGAAGKGYFVVFEECLGDTRFGADEASGRKKGCAPNWNELDWSYIETDNAGYITSTPCATNDSGVKWESSAHVAWILQQRPMRVYMHAKQILPP